MNAQVHAEGDRAAVPRAGTVPHQVAETLNFPKGFLWGAATAAHQVEGQNTRNDWWRAEQLGLLLHRSGDACRSWELFDQDVGLLREMGLNAYRMSVEWARIEPEPGRFDQAALGHYRRQLESLRAAGIEPLLTLHHFTNPTWLADRGGWANRDVVGWLARYADRVAHSLGDLVTWWVTINEPSILALKSYLEGSWPPLRPKDLRGYTRMLRHAVYGHAEARAALRAHRSTAQASLAFAVWPMEPHRAWHPGDRLATVLADWFWQGRVLRRTAPNLDWVGVNYYTRVRVAFPPLRGNQEQAATDPHAGSGEYTDFGWEIYPRGLYSALWRVSRLGKPVFVTENGMSDADDDQRPGYILAHLREIHRAIQAGMDVRGYMHWSLLDNFEWAEGFTQRFGLAHVDFDAPAKTRTPRPSAHLYGDVARANAITPELLARHASILASPR